ncbi:MAG: hypothetical protein QNK29_02000 [Desulfobacterales bacterium]|nr:hypothetical protein [Desulfobacterales bacterium]MDX2510787.1 hypothetical protein [Desulfobacterales bacterium]
MTIVTAVLWIFLLGCAGSMVQQEIASFPRDARATLFFNHLDMTVEKYAVSDASGYLVPGFPYLRSNRFLAAMKERLVTPDAGVYWVEQMLKLGLRSHRKELSNLSTAALMELSIATGEAIDRETMYQKTEAYALELFRDDQANPDFMEFLKRAVTIPDEYSSTARFFGLYPLASIPVTIATSMAYSRLKKWHGTDLNDLDIDGRLIRFLPETPVSVDHQTFMNDLYNPRSLDIFGLPVLTQQEERRLADTFAPIIYQDVAKNYDRIGKIIWQDKQVRVDTGQPAAYFYTSHNFLDGHPVLQINYAFWYSERAGKNAPWIERGPLDGLSYRVTLDRTGKPVMVDIMNSCGCYYFYVPQNAIIAEVVTRPGEIAPLVPTWLPAEFPAKQINLRVNSGWHQVQKVFVENGLASGIAYALIPYETLESLPKGTGQMESVFLPTGIMKNSWRIEPYIFFSMGIHDIGYMRQRGHHAIKMVGRGHFTDPDVFDRSFLYTPIAAEP